MTVYAIEYVIEDGTSVPRFGHTAVAAPDANAALAEFLRNHPDADVTEMRRLHV